jgi:hypothetical protein
MFGRRRPQGPDPALLARVSDTTDVDLGTFPEDALAVVGAYPARRALDQRPDSPSSFRRLDSQARKASMQSALDRLIAEQALTVRAGARLQDVVADGLDGKLEVNGPLADLYRLSLWFHNQGLRAGLIINLYTSDGLHDVQLPDGVPARGLETCFGLPPSGDGDTEVLLVERPDYEASTRSYTLRTVRREFSRMADFLFADVTREGEALLASVLISFRFGQATLKVDADFFRKHGDDAAHGRLTTQAQGTRRKQEEREPTFIKVPFSDLPDTMTTYFAGVAARTQ